MTNQGKFKALVHYVLSQRADALDTLGAVKLNKILWLADLTAFYERGEPITHSRYNKRQYGPVPAGITLTLRELEREGVLTIRESDHFGKLKKEYVVHRKIDGDFLDPASRQIVDRIINHVCDRHTATSISEETHNHIWKIAEDGEELPLYTVFATPGKITDIERMWASSVLSAETE